ncbi:MAG TPA: hypothetical protein VMX17_12360 [Candidatus Glassbacteria bacterium]|nr:hypothetical protein [Nitrosopumilaceae archaeon]HUU88529.1 hypothetical protein [Candidatus Glassbacteria bacterium]
MNAERLHALCLSLQKEINQINIHQKLQQVVQFLQNIVNQPQQPQPQQQLSNVVTQLHNELSNSQSDAFSPAWRQAFEEIGGEKLLGIALSERIREIIEHNQITPSSAHQEIQKIQQEFEHFKSGIDNTVAGLKSLNIGYELLKPGECEVGVVIPRKAVNNQLNEFGKELQELNFIFGTFSELASGSRENYKIKSISSSDLGIYLAAIPPVVACIAHATEKIIDIYKKLIEIRKIKTELKMLGLKEKEIQGITDHSNKIMKKGIKTLTVEIVNNYYCGNDENRKNELSNAVKISLNKIANRIDQGFNIEVRAKPEEKPDEKTGKTDQQDKNQAFIRKVIEASETLRFLKLDGERILSLPEKAELKRDSVDKIGT